MFLSPPVGTGQYSEQFSNCTINYGQLIALILVFKFGILLTWNFLADAIQLTVKKNNRLVLKN